jgi:hypothetical protein
VTARLAAPALFIALAIAACAPTVHVSLPPDATAREVLDTYLAAIVRGDCATGRALATATFREGNGDLCGAVRVTHASVDADAPTRPNDAETVFATTLTTGGSSDGTVPAGDITWFYVLDRQNDGSWRISGGGSGP